VANVRLVGETVTGLFSTATPVPVRAIDWGLVEALSVTVSDAVRLPRAEGVNVTVMLQFSPAPRLFGLMGQFPPQAYSVGAFPPEITMLLILSGPTCLFFNVAVFGRLATPTA
jgi:hypothetical protein